MPEATEPVPVIYREINLTPDEVQRFWSKVDKSGGADACWLWTASRVTSGYGCFGIKRRLHGAHRIAWVLANVAIPGALHVCHRCDNPACCNPAHLFLGTREDNMRDKVAKGRCNLPRGDDHYSRLHPEKMARGDANGSRTHPESKPRGESHSNAKLTASQVIEIRTLYAAGLTTQIKLAAKFSVSQDLISLIINRKAWKHI